mmetsp:Transcript_25574/g.79777  ORF Transcript_25574/g.79777 Transcript_25574/m.79777 type:complete len:222 (+) Transcript_25574:1010-1675(+)
MEFPDDPTAASVTGQWMDGAILAAPILNEDSVRSVYIPEGSWYSLRASEITQAPGQHGAFVRTLYQPQGLHRSVDLIEGPVRMGGTASFAELPAFVRAGTVLPLAPVVQHTDALPGGPLEVQVYSGADGAFDLVEDDGETLGYEEGEVRYTHLRWDDAQRTLSWKVQGTPFVNRRQVFRELFVRVFHGRSGCVTSETSPMAAEGSVRVSLEAGRGSEVHHL